MVWRLLGGILLAHFVGGAATAQTVTTAMLVGTVRDASAAVLTESIVTVTNLDTNLTRETVSDSAGRFQVTALEPGRYRVSAMHAGFATSQLEPVVVTLGETAAVDLTLEIASFAQQVTVTAQTPAVDVRRTDPSTVIRQQQIASLPLNGRDFVALSLLTAGAVEDRTPQQGVSRNSGLSFHGQRARSNSILIDGLDDNGMATGSIRGIFSQDAIQEFQVFSGAYSAEFGQASGGTVNIITASGTNRLSGKAFPSAEIERSSSLPSNDGTPLPASSSQSTRRPRPCSTRTDSR